MLVFCKIYCILFEHMKITIKPDFLIRSISGEHILIGAGEQIDFSQMLLLNKTAVFLIRHLQEHPSTPEYLARQLTVHYDDVSYPEALSDVLEIVHQLEQLQVVIISEQ